VAAHDPRGTLWRVECLMEPSRVAVPHGWLLRGRSRRGQGHHVHDSRTDVTPRMRDVRDVSFRATGSPLHRLTLIEERDPGPICQGLGKLGARRGHQESRPMGCRLPGRVNRGWNPPYGSTPPLSYHLAPIYFCLSLFHDSFFLLNHRPPPWLLSSHPHVSGRRDPLPAYDN
jgi:hypothetical protein